MGHILRFIEFMDVGNLNQWRSDQVVTAQEIIGMIDREMPLEPVGKSYRGEVADRYGYADGKGEIGVISSVSNPFCGDCTGPASRRRGRCTPACSLRRATIYVVPCEPGHRCRPHGYHKKYLGPQG